jgi:hypothetical protein
VPGRRPIGEWGDMATRRRQRNPSARPQRGEPRNRKRTLAWIWTALGTLGVLGAIGGYYIPGILKTGGEVVTNRAPLDYDLVLARDATPNYVFPASLDPSSVPLDRLQGTVTNFSQWALEHGGVIAGDQAVRVVLRGRESSPVIVNGLAARILSTQQPRSGWFNAWDGCGAAVDTREIHVDLSRSPPSTTWYDENGREMRPLTLQVTSTDHEVIDVFAHTTREEVQWVLEVSYTSAGKDGVLRIDNRGKPFVVTALGNAVGYQYYDGPTGLERSPDLDRQAQRGEPMC